MKLSMKLAGLAIAGLLAGIGATGCGDGEKPVDDNTSAIETTAPSDATTPEQEPTDDSQEAEQLDDECFLRDTDDTLGESTLDVCSIRVQDQTVQFGATEDVSRAFISMPAHPAADLCIVSACGGDDLGGVAVSLSIVCYDGQDTFGVAVPEASVNDPGDIQYWTSGLVDGVSQPVGFIAVSDVVDGSAMIQPLEDALTQRFGDMTDLNNSCDNPRVVHEDSLHDMFATN